MVKIKKIIRYLFSAILTISLIAGYFCFMPNLAQAAPALVTVSDISFSDCQGAQTVSPYMFSSATPAHAIALCCIEKNDHNSQTRAINLDIFSLDNIGSQSILSVQITDNYSADYAISFDYPISPTQTELLSSVIIRG